MGPPSKPPATPPPSTTTTTSTCTVEAAQGTHLFHIEGYSLHERLVSGKSIRSATFSVGGDDWAVRFCRDRGVLDLVLELQTKNAMAMASCAFRFLNPATGEASASWAVRLLNYRSGVVSKAARVSVFRRHPLMYAHDDRLTIECVVTVVQESKVSATKTVTGVEEPPSDLSEHLGRLLEEKEGCDVTFNVQGESMSAHKIVLAMRSPVFMAKFYGPEKGESIGCIAVDVDDVRPSVFRALLHFIYTDSMPDVDDLSDDEGKEMFRNLLVAADQYEIEKLVLICEDYLCKSLSTDCVATTLALAEQHNLCKLKDACIQFVTLSNKVDDVVASQGYLHVKRSYPSVLLEVLEKSSKLRRV